MEFLDKNLTFRIVCLDSTIMETKEVKKLDMINGLQEGFSIIYFTARLFKIFGKEFFVLFSMQ